MDEIGLVQVKWYSGPQDLKHGFLGERLVQGETEIDGLNLRLRWYVGSNEKIRMTLAGTATTGKDDFCFEETLRRKDGWTKIWPARLDQPFLSYDYLNLNARRTANRDHVSRDEALAIEVRVDRAIKMINDSLWPKVVLAHSLAGLLTRTRKQKKGHESVVQAVRGGLVRLGEENEHVINLAVLNKGTEEMTAIIGEIKRRIWELMDKQTSRLLLTHPEKETRVRGMSLVADGREEASSRKLA